MNIIQLFYSFQFYDDFVETNEIRNKDTFKRIAFIYRMNLFFTLKRNLPFTEFKG